MAGNDLRLRAQHIVSVSKSNSIHLIYLDLAHENQRTGHRNEDPAKNAARVFSVRFSEPDGRDPASLTRAEFCRLLRRARCDLQHLHVV